jgi:hypothetical protein
MPSSLRTAFQGALSVANATPKDVAAGIGRAYRTLHAYREGSRSVTVDAARGLVRYLRQRARRMQEAADALEATIPTREERDG